MRTIALLLVAALAGTPAAAQTMYKWVDKDGKTHYTDSPPPDDAKKLAPPKGSSSTPTPAPSKGRGGEPAAAAADGREKTQRDFQPDEQAAVRTLCAISLLDSLTCHLELNRHCTLDELVKGIKGGKGLARDPRNDPNYDYRMEARGDDTLVFAVPKAAGLTGFYADNSGTYYKPGGAAGKGDRKISGGTSCSGEIAR